MISSHELAAQLFAHRANDVKVNIDGNFAPVASAAYHRAADAMIIELDTDHEDTKVAVVHREIWQAERVRLLDLLDGMHAYSGIRDQEYRVLRDRIATAFDHAFEETSDEAD